MTNEAIQDAEESTTIEKTAIEQEQPATINEAPQQSAADAGGTATERSPSIEDSTPHTDAAESAKPADAADPPADSSEGQPETTTDTVDSPDAAAAAAPSEDTATDAAPQQPAAPMPLDTTPPVRKPNRVVMAPKVPFSTAPPPAAAPAAQVDEPAPSGDIDFGAILEQFEQEQAVFHQGDLVEGKIVGITDRGVLVDFGHKSEGFVPVEEFTGPGGEMTAVVGDSVEVIIRTMHAGDSAPQLSRIDALGRKVWDDIEAAYNSEQPVTGRVVDKTKGGLRIDINGVEAFLPGSQIDSRPIRGLDSYIGQEIEAQVIKFSRRRNNIVLSRKIITDKIINVQKAETLSRIQIGYIVDGTIKNLTEYGAFVDIGGIDGLLHVTDMSWGRIHHPGDQFKVGEHIQVKVLKLDREREKVSLGYKQLLPDPWSTVVEVYPVNTKLTGTVSSVTEYGVFVELEPGVEGLVHVSEISWSRRAQSPKRLFNKGQQVEVQVLGVDTVEKRISLGMKQFAENPWDTVDVKYPIGMKVIGRVRNLTDFGAFVELEEGIDGLVHVSDITWAKKIKHPKDVLKKDQEVEAVVTSIDKRGQRLSLSMKDLTPSVWESFVATHRPGDVVRGKVSRFTNFGVFVELGEGLEGLCHISELSEERVDRPESVAELGQEMDFKILRIEPAEQKIGLSHRAVGKASDPVVDTKIYSSEAKGGMASLGELANLRRGDAAAEPEIQEDPEERKRAKQAAKKAKAEEFAAREAEAAAAKETGDTDQDAAAQDTDSEVPSPGPDAAAETAAMEDKPKDPAGPDAEASEEPAVASETSLETVAEATPSGEALADEASSSGAGPHEEAAADSTASDTVTAEAAPDAPSNEKASEEAPSAETSTDEKAAAPTDEAPDGEVKPEETVTPASEIAEAETTTSETGPAATSVEGDSVASTPESVPQNASETEAADTTADDEQVNEESEKKSA